MHYCEVSIASPNQDAYEILIAELAGLGFESFTEENNLLKAYIPECDYNEDHLNELLSQYQQYFEISFEVTHIPYQNWNEVWESNFPPVVIADKLYVRAPFHAESANYPLEIIISPKMSFGTGHHATTSLVLELLLEMELHHKKVLDFGTGTGILAILAKKLGAGEAWAVDNDAQCMENAAENTEMNHFPDIKLRLGDITAVEDSDFDIIIGNITRNVIVEFLPEISKKLKKSGIFVASGFYEEDLDIITENALPQNLQLQKQLVKDNWCAATFIKN
jgi:ribosomal protein L11 methyltransferase